VTFASTIARARAAMQARMTDTCTIEVQAGTTADGYTDVPTYTEVYSGQCEFVQRGEQATIREVAGRDVATLPGVLRLPAGTEGVVDGAKVTCTGSTHRPGLAGDEFTVSGVDFASNRSAVRVGLTAVT